MLCIVYIIKHAIFLYIFCYSQFRVKSMKDYLRINRPLQTIQELLPLCKNRDQLEIKVKISIEVSKSESLVCTILDSQ